MRAVKCKSCDGVINYSDAYGPAFASPLACKCTDTPKGCADPDACACRDRIAELERELFQCTEERKRVCQEGAAMAREITELREEVEEANTQFDLAVEGATADHLDRITQIEQAYVNLEREKDIRIAELGRRLEEASRAWKDYRENKRFRGSDAPSTQRAWDELTRALGDE